MTKTGHCRSCKKPTTFALKAQVFGNGSENFVWVCSVCETKNPGGDKEFYIDAAKVRAHLSPEEIEALPRIMPTLFNRCVRCGARDTEAHHWAPKGIFGSDESNRWPQDYLCKGCHDQWHRMVTPQLVKTP